MRISVLLLMLLFASCANNNHPQVAGKPAKDVSVQKEVRKMAADIANDLSVAGPAAWLNYFEQTPAFFMANDGQRVFVNNDSATRFVKEVLAINIMKIKLTWSNVYVDSLSPSLAVISANYSEVMIDKDNKNINAAGYFTGTAEKTTDGWKFRNLHWSSLSTLK